MEKANFKKYCGLFLFAIMLAAPFTASASAIGTRENEIKFLKEDIAAGTFTYQGKVFQINAITSLVNTYSNYVNQLSSLLSRTKIASQKAGVQKQLNAAKAKLAVYTQQKTAGEKIIQDRKDTLIRWTLELAQMKAAAAK